MLSKLHKRLEHHETWKIIYFLTDNLQCVIQSLNYFPDKLQGVNGRDDFFALKLSHLDFLAVILKDP
jgi:hypothetical protein